MNDVERSPFSAEPQDIFDRFAPFYDHDYRDQVDDLLLIEEIAQECGGPVLELGCGTGRVALPLLAAGLHVTGIDISPALLELARTKISEQGATGHAKLVEGDMRAFDLGRSDYSLAICASNTFMHLESQADQSLALAQTHRHLRPGGWLWIDLFNVDLPRLLAVNGVQELADMWEDHEQGVQILKWSVRMVDVAEQIQETLFIYEEISPDGRTRRTACPFRLRFLWRAELELMLQMAGFQVLEVWGDYDGRPFDDQSDRLMVLAAKS